MKYLAVAKMVEDLAETFPRGSEEWRIIHKLAGTARQWHAIQSKKP